MGNNAIELFRLGWSGREDSNLRPLGPKPSALPGCATPRLPCQVSHCHVKYLEWRCILKGSKIEVKSGSSLKFEIAPRESLGTLFVRGKVSLLNFSASDGHPEGIQLN